MRWLYDFSIFLYSTGIRMAALFGHPKAQLAIQGRKNWRKDLQSKLSGAEKRIWVHCASLGEFEQGRPLIERLRTQFPSEQIVLTFFSPSGFEIRKNYSGADCVCYLPFDSKSNARDFIRIVNPEFTCFIKYDYWFHYLNELSRRQINSYFIAAIFRKDQLFFKSYGSFYRRMLKLVHHFFLQDESSAQLLKEININRFSVCGDTRFDRVIKIADTTEAIPLLEKFRVPGKTLIAGSTWPDDEKLLADAFSILKKSGMKLIVVPHDPSPAHVIRIQETFSTILQSTEIKKISEADDQSWNAKLIIIDRIGILSAAYRSADFAFIGGGFGKGVHNTLEAAVYGIPIFTGPNYNKFLEIRELMQSGAATCVRSGTELAGKIQYFLSNPEEYKAKGQLASGYVRSRAGATERIMNHLSRNP